MCAVQSLVSRAVVYPEDTNWEEVVVVVEHTRTPDLVEAMFGAEPIRFEN